MIQLLNCLLLHELVYQEYCRRFLNILQEINQFIMMETIFPKTFLILTEAIPALKSQYLASVLYMKLLGVVYFCEHLRLMKSMIKFVLDFFMLAKWNELWSIFPQCIVFYYSSSLIKF